MSDVDKSKAGGGESGAPEVEGGLPPLPNIIYDPTQCMIFEPSYDDAGYYRLWGAERRMEIVEWTRAGEGWYPRWQVHKPYINIVELMLPKRDGMDVLRRLKAYDPKCRVIFTMRLEGKWAAEVANKALEHGADAIVPKPLTKDRFLASLDYVLKMPNKKKKGRR